MRVGILVDFWTRIDDNSTSADTMQRSKQRKQREQHVGQAKPSSQVVTGISRAAYERGISVRTSFIKHRLLMVRYGDDSKELLKDTG